MGVHLPVIVMLGHIDFGETPLQRLLNDPSPDTPVVPHSRFNLGIADAEKMMSVGTHLVSLTEAFTFHSPNKYRQECDENACSWWPVFSRRLPAGSRGATKEAVLDLARGALGTSPGSISFCLGDYVGQGLKCFIYEKGYSVSSSEDPVRGRVHSAQHSAFFSHPILRTSRPSNYLAHITDDIDLM